MNLKIHAPTSAIFSQMNKMFKFTIPWYLLHNSALTWSFHIFTIKCVHLKPVYPVIWWGTRKEKPARFLEIVILCKALCGNFKRKLCPSLCYHMTWVYTCFHVCIYFFDISVHFFSILLFLRIAIFSFSFRHSQLVF